MLQQSRLPRSWTQGGDVTKGSALETASLRLAGVEPWKVVAGSAGVSLAIAYLYSLTQVTWNLPSWSASHLLTLDTQGRQPLTARLRARFFQLVRKIPAVKKHVSHRSFDSSSLNIGSPLASLFDLNVQIEGEKEKIRSSFEKEYSEATEASEPICTL